MPKYYFKRSSRIQVIVNVINEKMVTLELLSQKLLDYFDTIEENNKISLHNQKKLFIEKWNANLFLHKSSGMTNKTIKLCSLYEKPNFLFNNKKATNLDVVFLEFLENNKKRLITILGNPGLGKSSLMCYFAQKYESFSNFVFIKMHELEPARANNSLLDAITDFLECKNRDLKNKVLFLDGYDELRVDNRHYELCLQLASEIYSISGLKVIISSRLNYIDLDKKKFKSDFAMADTIELIPFNKTQMFKFIQKYNSLVGNKLNTRLFKQFQNISTGKEIFGIPFFLYLICSLDIDINNIQNIFNIYDKVFAFNGGIYDKIYDANSGHYLTRNPENKKELLSISQLFAFEMFKGNSIEISMKIVDYIVRTNYPRRENDFAIGNYYNIETNRLMFVHKTFYEYFLCKYILENIKKIFSGSFDNTQILKMLWNLFHENYIYTRLENLLELALKRDDIFCNTKIINCFRESCQYILEKFVFISSECNNFEIGYCELQNFLSSICKIFKLVLGTGWIRYVRLKNTYWGILLKSKGYVRIDLEYINLKNTDISGSVLRGNLMHSTLISCNMCRIDICGCNAEYSKWIDTDIKLAYAVKAKLNDLVFEKVAFDLSNLNKSELCNAKVSNASFNLIDGNRIRFSNSVLSNVEFKGAKLNYADFQDAGLENIKFSDAILENGNFYNATLNNVDFSNANLSHADFRGAIFTKIVIKDTKMDGAIFDESGIKWLINAGIKINKQILIETDMNNCLMTYRAYKEQLNQFN